MSWVERVRTWLVLRDCARYQRLLDEQNNSDEWFEEKE